MAAGLAPTSGLFSCARKSAATEFEADGTMAEPIGPLHFVWQGRAYREAPKALPLIQFYVRRELRRAGLHPHQLPIAAIAVGRRCGDPGVDWGALAALPG